MTTPTAAPAPGAAPGIELRPTPGALEGAVAGAVAAACALAAGELAAGLLPGTPSPIAAVGAALIDLAPPGSKDVIVGLFGTADKLALGVLVAGVVLLVGAGIGWLGRRGLLPAALAVAALAGVGAVAGLRSPLASPTLALLSSIVQAGVGIQVLIVLLGADGRPARDAGAQGADDRDVDEHEAAAPSVAVNGSRRGFLLRAGVLGALALAGGGIGRALSEGRAAAVAGEGTGTGPGTAGLGAPGAGGTFPPVTDPAPTLPPGASLDVPGITPLIVPNADFYRIDTALLTPAVDITGWNLRVHGMVDKEVTLTFADLLELPLIERYVTIACVSNEVGGRLVGNARWTGVRLSDVLDMAGVQAGATQVVPRSVDGWAAGFPTSWITDPAHPRDAMIALRMNGAPLPAEHGFPARLIVPGLYGYVSATKWLSELELTTLEAFDAYWVPRGWAKEAPILTQSRIDTPRSGDRVATGSVAVAGVAWAPDRGISRVEVAVDGGDWQPAILATELGPQTWVQWKLPWLAAPGDHTLTVRATDGTGDIQTDQVTRPDPDGARGHHAISVSVG